jgi:sugar phosphate isomerase/epimerase
MRLACQEKLLPPGPALDRWEHARGFGFDGVELIGDTKLVARRGELLAARRRGAVYSSVCVASDRFIGDFDPERRKQAGEHLRRLVDLIAELDGAGVVTPAAWGLWTNSLPRPTPVPRTPAEDRAVLVEALNELGAHAGSAGVHVFLEPLNRYEDHMVNRLAQGLELAEASAGPAVRLTADLYHMNIEEADPLAALRAAGVWVGHVHASDSNRGEPGAGHVDWAGVRAALRDIGFDGWLAIECRLSGPPEVALPAATRVLRG